MLSEADEFSLSLGVRPGLDMSLEPKTTIVTGQCSIIELAGWI